MKTWVKVLSAVLIMALLLSSCGNKEAADNNRPTIKWLTTGDAAAKPIQENDRIVKAIEDKLGINLEVQVVPEDSVEKVNVTMASGDFPDIVTGAYGTAATQQWIEDGMVITLDSYLDNAPALKRRLTEDYGWELVNGKHYGVPFVNQFTAANSLLVMRADWLEKLGMNYPATLDEMTAVLTAFTKDDPDGDGKDNTYGFTAGKPVTDAFNWVFFAYGLPHGDYSLDADNNVIPWFEDPSFIPSMKYIKALWDEGLIDPEIMLNERSKAEEKFYQGKAGTVFASLFRHVNRHEGNLKQLYPDASIAFGLPPKGPDGKYGINKQGKRGKYTCVTAKSENPEKAVALIDFLLSKEGGDLVRLGIEGIHYKNENGKIVMMEEERAKDGFAPNGWAHPLAWGVFFWPLESGYLPESEPNRDRALESVVLATDAQVKSLVPRRIDVEVKYGTLLEDLVIQYFSDMLQGKVSIEEGVKELKAEWLKQGGDKVLKAINEKYHQDN